MTIVDYQRQVDRYHARACATDGPERTVAMLGMLVCAAAARREIVPPPSEWGWQIPRPIPGHDEPRACPGPDPGAPA